MSNYSLVRAMIERFSSREVLKSPKEDTNEIMHNILLIGESGVGKSTFINAIANYLTFNDYEHAKQSELRTRLIGTSFSYFDCNDEYKTIKAFDDENEMPNEWVSDTHKPKPYKLYLGNQEVIRVIDTQGVCDTRDTNTVGFYVERIMNVIVSYKEITAICVFLKADDTKLSNIFQNCLIKLFSRFHSSIDQNLVFIFTAGKKTNFKPLHAIRFANKFFDTIKVNTKITSDNSFVFDNDVYNYLLALRQSVELEISEPELSWQQSSEISKKLINHLLSLKPHNVVDTIEVNKYCNFIEKLTAELMKITQFIEHYLFKILPEKPEDSIDSKKLCERQETIFTDSSGKIVTKKCNEDCGLLTLSKVNDNNAIFVPKSLYGKQLNCKNCQNSIDCKIFYFEPKIVNQVEVIKEKKMVRFTEDKKINEDKQTNGEKVINDDQKTVAQKAVNVMPHHRAYIAERDAVIEALALIHFHRKANSLCKYGDYTKKTFRECVDQLKAVNIKQIASIKEVLALYTKQKTLIKANSKQAVNSDEIEKIIETLMKLTFHGSSIQKIYQTLDKKSENIDILPQGFISVPFFETVTSPFTHIKQMNDKMETKQTKSGVTAIALFDYQASDDDEISFDPNEMITDIEMVDDGWWIGMCRGVYGLFPSNFVEPIDDD